MPLEELHMEETVSLLFNATSMNPTLSLILTFKIRKRLSPSAIPRYPPGPTGLRTEFSPKPNQGLSPLHLRNPCTTPHPIESL